jgi:asparagine synthase (glutamine-hydrolysing)
LAGFLGGDADAGEENSVLRKMADQFVLRGPDDDGYWSDTGQRMGLGHRCLAMVDLSPAGHQPMVSASGRYVIVFNGEIYNHLDLRRELEKTGLPRRDAPRSDGTARIDTSASPSRNEVVER